MKNVIHYLRSLFLLELWKGLSVTGRYLFKKKFTLNYPEQKAPVSPRFRGLHAQRRYPNGEERCIALFKCIFCGFCEESCPVDAIVETRVYEYCFEDFERAENAHIMTKEKLLAMGDKYEAQIAADRAVQAKYR